MTAAAIPAEAFEHGDYRRYRRGCRCKKCKDGNNRKTIQNRYLRQTGRGIMRAPDVAADHILRLRNAGLDDQAIRDQADICPDVMYRILRREGTIHARTETRILAVPVPPSDGPSGSRAYIPARGTIRRLHALVAGGWYFAELARRLGKDREGLKQIVARGEDGLVAQFVAEQVAALYSQLHADTPEAHGISGYYVERARALARQRGWPAPAYWDDEDFENPDFDPASALREPTFLERAKLRREEIEHLAWCGHEPEQILARLNGEVSISTVRQIVQDWRTGQKRDRRKSESAVADLAA